MIWLLIGAWFIVSNSYFGWNWTPQSGAEMACDGIMFVLVAIAGVSKTVGG